MIGNVYLLQSFPKTCIDGRQVRGNFEKVDQNVLQ